jgi:hypothetical protein
MKIKKKKITVEPLFKNYKRQEAEIQLKPTNLGYFLV